MTLNIKQMDERTKGALDRLKSSPDFRVFRDHLLAHRAAVNEALVNAPAAEVPPLQGRARLLRDLLDL